MSINVWTIEKRPKKELRKIVSESSLSESQQAVWHAFIDSAKETQVEAILEVVRDNRDTLPILTDNLLDKLVILRKSD